MGPIYGVQFYPDLAPGVDPFFAVTGGCETLVCRLTTQGDEPVEVVRAFKDVDTGARLNSCAWTKDLATSHPLICVAGTPPKINVLDIVTGQVVKNINDLAVSPVSSDILASGSDDRSIRIWSLNDRHQTQPCALICAGQGHREAVLTIAFHASGRYLLSGGMDCTVNLWLLPELPNDTTGSERPRVLHYPHFSTSAIHSDYVDCVMFFHDLVLSKCAREGKIVLWRISGFDGALAPPSVDEAPVNLEHHGTQSAFGDGYERLLQFQVPNVDPFYRRFGLFHQPNKHAVLAMGNLDSAIFFWDFQRLVDQTASTDGSDMSDPFKELPAHKSVVIKGNGFLTRQIAWSVGGEWMVAVGDQGTIAIFGRWETKEHYVQDGAQF
ncbi:MAG: hypothetical protein M1816_000132 [Peltula sp. TS41687]|nr:MAG: hypothetical protein M1816_000132 [Peltula sp. TS41687]